MRQNSAYCGINSPSRRLVLFGRKPVSMYATKLPIHEARVIWPEACFDVCDKTFRTLVESANNFCNNLLNPIRKALITDRDFSELMRYLGVTEVCLTTKMLEFSVGRKHRPTGTTAQHQACRWQIAIIPWSLWETCPNRMNGHLGWNDTRFWSSLSIELALSSTALSIRTLLRGEINSWNNLRREMLKLYWKFIECWNPWPKSTNKSDLLLRKIVAA